MDIAMDKVAEIVRGLVSDYDLDPTSSTSSAAADLPPSWPPPSARRWASAIA